MQNRILIVDDNRDLARAMSMMLCLSGFETATAFDGMTALTTARSFLPQIALLDIGLPDMDGTDLARTLREELEPGHITLIAISAMEPFTRDYLRIKAIFDHYLVKPVDLDALLTILFQPCL